MREFPNLANDESTSPLNLMLLGIRRRYPALVTAHPYLMQASCQSFSGKLHARRRIHAPPSREVLLLLIRMGKSPKELKWLKP